jgi:hypothetical protein
MQKRLLFPLSVLVVFLLFSAIFVFVEKNDLFYSFFYKDQPFISLTSNERGYPVVGGNGQLSIFSLDKNKIKTMDVVSIQGDRNASYTYKGSNAALSSPNSLYTAFIDKDRADLWVVSNETLKKNQVTRDGKMADFITAWSPDSKKILYVTGTNINNDGEGGIDHGNVIKSKPRFSSSNFYLYNVETGISTEIPELISIDRFFDNDSVLVNGNGDLDIPLTGQISIFNFQTRKFTESGMPNLNTERISEYSISPDHKRWAIFTPHQITIQKGKSLYFTEDKQEILSDFPELSGESIVSGDFGDFGNPIFSPDSLKMAFYSKQQGLNARTNLIVYSVLKRNSQAYEDSIPVRWIDDTLLIVSSFKTSHLYVLNLQTGERIQIQ